jgi:hypothetical protein
MKLILPYHVCTLTTKNCVVMCLGVKRQKVVLVLCCTRIQTERFDIRTHVYADVGFSEEGIRTRPLANQIKSIPRNTQSI